MSTATTPGPWTVAIDDQVPERGAVYVEGPEGWDKQAVCDCTYSEEGVERDEANARLIAAAPDLLDALRDICDAWDSDDGGRFKGNVTKAHAIGRAVIAKAEGRS